MKNKKIFKLEETLKIKQNQNKTMEERTKKNDQNYNVKSIVFKRTVDRNKNK